MEKLYFHRKKYGKELLMDASTTAELDIVSDRMIPSFYIIMFVKAAKGSLYLDAEKVDLRENIVIFSKPSQINYVAEAEFQEGHFIFFEGDFLDEFFNDKNFIYKLGYFNSVSTPSFLTLKKQDFDKFNAIAAEIRTEIRELTQDSHHILRSLTYYLLVRLNQLYGKAYDSQQDTILNSKMLQFLRSLSSNIRNHQNVQYYAEHLNISRVHLNKLCQKYFSKTARQLIREQLLAEIKKEIQYTDKDFSEIAYDFNFSAPSHFTRFFKQMMDTTPQAYKEGLSKW